MLLRIERKLNRLDGVTAAVNFATETASVRYDPARVEVAELIETIRAIGYDAKLPSELGDEDETVALLRRRLIVAAVLSVPVAALAMIPSFEFSGWKWVALVLSTPVVLWAGWGFHRATVLNLRHGAATMDTLISIGTLAAWGWSVVAVVFSTGAPVYFEVGGDHRHPDPARPLLRGARPAPLGRSDPPALEAGCKGSPCAARRAQR